MEEAEQSETWARVRAVVEQHGAEALLGPLSLEEATRAWIGAGFTEPEEVDEWLAARCFSAEGAHKLEMAGITPEQAAMPTTAGREDYEETIGYKLIKGDLSLDEARRIITAAFWD